MIQINVELDEDIKSYSFPTTWDDLTVEQYSNLYSIDRTVHTGMFFTFEVLHKLTGIDRDIIEQIDYKDFVQLVKGLEFIYTPLQKREVESIEIEGEKYYLQTEFNKFTAGEIISIDTIISKANGELNTVLSKLLCVFLKKKKPNGEFEKYKTSFMLREQMFSKIKISDVHHIFGFFLHGRDSSDNSTMVSSESK
jgi:hypothetical protein